MVFYYELVDNADPTKYAPFKKHVEDAGWDLKSYLTDGPVEIPAKGSATIPTAVRLKFPDGYVALIKSRSGLSVNNSVEHGAGVVDSSYEGLIMVKLHNHGSEPFVVEDAMRIAQVLFVPIYCGALMNINEKNNTERGSAGFSSTGLF